MAKFEKRKDSIVSQIEDEIENGFDEPFEAPEIAWGDIPVVSTGSTLLDLAISGGRVYEGGIPACILAEFYGPAGSGKTALLSELGANVQRMNGEIMYQDPEARLDREYARIYGIEINKKNYHRPSTVHEVFELIKKWDTDVVPRALLTDSLAALTTDLEIETGDKMGMRRAKEFSAGLRVHARTISDMLWAASNQEREGDNGHSTTPGGKAVAYYASLRIRIRQVDKISVEKKFVPTNIPDWLKKSEEAEGKKKKDGKLKEVKVSQFIGIESECFITKSTVDDPYRYAPVYIIFGQGIDDVRGNLQYLKEMYSLTSYPTPNGKKFMGIESAVLYIKENGLVEELRDQVIKTWHEAYELIKNRGR